MQIDSQSAVEVSLPEIFFSHVGMWLIPSAHACLFLTLTASAVCVTQLCVTIYKPHSLRQSPPPALCSPHTLWHFRTCLFTQGQVQESKCKPSFTDERSEIINLWEEGPTFFFFCWHLALGRGVRQCIMVRVKGIVTGLSLERKRSSRDKIHNILCKRMPLKPSLLPIKCCLLRVPPPTVCTLNWEPSIQHAALWETLIKNSINNFLWSCLIGCSTSGF